MLTDDRFFCRFFLFHDIIIEVVAIIVNNAIGKKANPFLVLNNNLDYIILSHERKATRYVNDKMMKKYSPLIIAILILWLLFILVLNDSLTKTGGHPVYALDDAYIHMAMAKNFSQHGIWGVTSQGFSSTSSSLLWTLLLSMLFAIFGVNETIPLLLNFFFATLLIVFIFYILRNYRFSAWLQALILMAFIIFIPLSYLVFGGLEHVLQILINFIYIYTAANVIAADSPTNEKTVKSMPYTLFLLAPLITMIRYEGLFILFAVSLLLLAGKKWLIFIINAAAGLLPLIIYGTLSLAKGWYLLPNSVLLKGTRPDITHFEKIIAFLYAGLRQVIYNIHLLVLLIVVLALVLVRVLVKKYDRFRVVPNMMALIFLVTLACQALFSESGYFLNRYPWIRYDCYLVALGMLTILINVGYWLPKQSRQLDQSTLKTRNINGKIGKITAGLLILVLILPLAERGLRTDFKVSQATANIYGQQYQVGLFLKKYYAGQPVIVNDIGVPCFLADIRCLDVWGLATKDTGALILAKTYSSETLGGIARQSGIRIAVVYDQFFRLIGIDSDLPTHWLKIAQWRIPNNIVCARDTVTFYALDESETAALTRNLKDFISQLPSEVIINF